MITKKTRIITPFTLIRCTHCTQDVKRPHMGGDYVCMKSECPRCSNMAFICGIFGKDAQS